jgi:hypothetical protein
MTKSLVTAAALTIAVAGCALVPAGALAADVPLHHQNHHYHHHYHHHGGGYHGGRSGGWHGGYGWGGGWHGGGFFGGHHYGYYKPSYDYHLGPRPPGPIDPEAF